MGSDDSEAGSAHTVVTPLNASIPHRHSTHESEYRAHRMHRRIFLRSTILPSVTRLIDSRHEESRPSPPVICRQRLLLLPITLFILLVNFFILPVTIFLINQSFSSLPVSKRQMRENTYKREEERAIKRLDNTKASTRYTENNIIWKEAEKSKSHSRNLQLCPDFQKYL